MDPTELKEELADLAMLTVMEVVEYGEQTHTPGSWVKEGLDHHIRRAITHLQDALEGNGSVYENLSHALCRTDMAVYSLNHELYGDHGAEGTGKESFYGGLQ